MAVAAEANIWRAVCWASSFQSRVQCCAWPPTTHFLLSLDPEESEQVAPQCPDPPFAGHGEGHTPTCTVYSLPSQNGSTSGKIESEFTLCDITQCYCQRTAWRIWGRG